MVRTKSETPAQIRFALSLSEYVRGHRTYLRAALLTPKTLALIAITFTLIGGQARLFGGGNAALWGLVAFWALVFLLIAYVYFLAPGRRYRSDPRLSQEQSLAIGDSGLLMATPGGGEEKIPWEQVTQRMEKKGFLLILREHRVPLVIPLRAQNLGHSDPSAEEFLRQLRERC